MRKKNDKLNFDNCKEIIYDVIKEKLNISKEEILSQRRTRILADSRRAIIKILKTKFPYSRVVILGDSVNRNHSSVSIQLRNHDELISYKNDYSDLFNLINEEFEKNSYDSNQSLDELFAVKINLEKKLETVNLLIRELQKNSFH
jgi:hypothetical protein